MMDHENEPVSIYGLLRPHLINVKGVFNNATAKVPLELEKLNQSILKSKDYTLVNPKKSMDGLWQLGGCALLLKFVEHSRVRKI